MIEFEEMVEKIKLNSRRYAKRQLTWFRRDERIKWLKIDDFNNIEDAADKILERYRKLKLTQ
jgi:tRNA dimethylallyltransferase